MGLYDSVTSPFKPLEFPEIPKSEISSAKTIKKPVDLINKANMLAAEKSTVPPIQDNTQVAKKPVFPEVIAGQALPEVPAELLANSSLDVEKFRKETIDTESDGNYQATNPNSSAVGAYQFLWNTHGKDIRKVTGVKSRQEFLNSKEAQDQYFNWHTDKIIRPAVQELAQLGASMGLSKNDLAKLVHFRGPSGARKVLESGDLESKRESYNMSPLQYLASSGP